MPKTKPSARSAKRKTSTRKIRRGARSESTRSWIKSARDSYTEEYAEYLERHELYGEGRPRLSPAEFNRLDEELLDLLALEAESPLNDDQLVRLQELEYLLLDEQSDSSF